MSVELTQTQKPIHERPHPHTNKNIQTIHTSNRSSHGRNAWNEQTVCVLQRSVNDIMAYIPSETHISLIPCRPSPSRFWLLESAGVSDCRLSLIAMTWDLCHSFSVGPTIYTCVWMGHLCVSKEYRAGRWTICAKYKKKQKNGKHATLMQMRIVDKK